MRTWAFNILAFVFIMAASSKATEKLVDKYFFFDGASSKLAGESL